MNRDKQTLIEWLHIWADHESAQIPGLSYPSITPEARLLHSPGRSSKPIVAPHYWPNSTHRAVSEAVASIERDLQEYLRIHYIIRLDRQRAAAYVCKPVRAWDWCLTKAHKAVSRPLRLHI